jgi:molecular chaperone DnaK (HSP70)
VREEIDRTLGHVPIIDSFQQDAVFKGLALHAAILDGTGPKESFLLLNVVRRAIGVKFGSYANEKIDFTDSLRLAVLQSRIENPSRRSDYHMIVPVVSGEGNDNIEIIIEEDTTIPTKKGRVVIFDFRQTETIFLLLVENYLSESEEEARVHLIDEIKIVATARVARFIEVVIGIDADGSVAMSFRDLETEGRTPEIEFYVAAGKLGNIYGGSWEDLGHRVQMHELEWTSDRARIFRRKANQTAADL